MLHGLLADLTKVVGGGSTNAFFSGNLKCCI